ncbi:MAG: hypothetical protein KDA75_14160, partial [Planctomycetaceae bacterium]|nr:hypothetical protein [Planctomycetaceae bacterium]
MGRGRMWVGRIKHDLALADNWSVKAPWQLKLGRFLHQRQLVVEERCEFRSMIDAIVCRERPLGWRSVPGGILLPSPSFFTSP